MMILKPGTKIKVTQSFLEGNPFYKVGDIGVIKQIDSKASCGGMDVYADFNDQGNETVAGKGIWWVGSEFASEYKII